jgi:hypothetical protein
MQHVYYWLGRTTIITRGGKIVPPPGKDAAEKTAYFSEPAVNAPGAWQYQVNE